MDTLPWFKHWNEALDNEMLYTAELSFHAIWWALLVLANKSPERGIVLHPNGTPIKLNTIARRASEHTTIEDVERAISWGQQWSELDIREDGAVVIVNWGTYNTAGKSGAERQRAYRERKQQSVEETAKEILFAPTTLDDLYERVTLAEGEEQADATWELLHHIWPSLTTADIHPLGRVRMEFRQPPTFWEEAARIALKCQDKPLAAPLVYLAGALRRHYTEHPPMRELTDKLPTGPKGGPISEADRLRQKEDMKRMLQELTQDSA